MGHFILLGGWYLEGQVCNDTFDYRPSSHLIHASIAPMRASSPASTISYPVSTLGPLPALNQLTQSMAPEMIQPPQPFIPLAQPFYKELEPPSSQVSVVSATHDVDQLNQMLPPKRDLPFSKPATKKRRAASLTKATPKQAKSAPSSSSQPTEKILFSGRGPNSTAADPIPGVLSGSNSQIPSQPDPCPEPSQPLSLIDEPSASLNTPPISEQTKKTSQVPVQGAAHTQDNLDNTDQVSKPNEKATAAIEDHLAQYLSSPTAERIAFLENWMSELLEDDKFLALCRDVDGTWRRFALGQKK